MTLRRQLVELVVLSLFTLSATAQTVNLSVSVAGTGSGTVTSTPSGINCGSTCTVAFSTGSNVTLTAAPASGSTFQGWSGASCYGSSCVVNMSAASSVTAYFSTAVTVSGAIIGADGNQVSSFSGGGVTWSSFSQSGSSTLSNSGSCITNISGTYTCSVPRDGQLSIYASQSGSTFTSLYKSNMPTLAESGLNLQRIPLALAISGTAVNPSGSPVSGISISWSTNDGQLSGSCGSTTSTGIFSCSVPQGFSGYLSARDNTSPPALIFPALGVSNLTSSPSGLTFQGAAISSNISGTVLDSANLPLSGIRVSWSSSIPLPVSGSVSTIVSGSCGTTTSSGTYHCVVPQSSSISISATDTASTPAYLFRSRTSQSTIAGDLTGIDFQAVALTRTISGTVRDAANNTLGGVSVNWTYQASVGSVGGACGTTSSSGTYTCTVPQTTSVSTPIVVAARDTTNPTVLTFSNIGVDTSIGNVAGKDFTASSLPRTVSGTVQDSAGNPLGRYYVYWYTTSGTGLSGSCGTTSLSGTFTCNLPQGFTGSVYASGTGFSSAFRSLSLTNVTSNLSNQTIISSSSTQANQLVFVTTSCALSNIGCQGLGREYFAGIGSDGSVDVPAPAVGTLPVTSPITGQLASVSFSLYNNISTTSGSHPVKLALVMKEINSSRRLEAVLSGATLSTSGGTTALIIPTTAQLALAGIDSKGVAVSISGLTNSGEDFVVASGNVVTLKFGNLISRLQAKLGGAADQFSSFAATGSYKYMLFINGVDVDLGRNVSSAFVAFDSKAKLTDILPNGSCGSGNTISSIDGDASPLLLNKQSFPGKTYVLRGAFSFGTAAAPSTPSLPSVSVAPTCPTDTAVTDTTTDTSTSTTATTTSTTVTTSTTSTTSTSTTVTTTTTTTLAPTKISTTTEVVSGTNANVSVDTSGALVVTATTGEPPPTVVLKTDAVVNVAIKLPTNQPVVIETGGKAQQITDTAGQSEFRTISLGGVTLVELAKGEMKVEAGTIGTALSVTSSNAQSTGSLVTTAAQTSIAVVKDEAKAQVFVDAGKVNYTAANQAPVAIYQDENATIKPGSGELTQLALGSQGGTKQAPGDPLPVVTPKDADTKVPKLEGTLARFNNTVSLLDIIGDAIRSAVGNSTGSLSYDKSTGTVTYLVGQTRYNVIALGDVLVQLNQAALGRANRFADGTGTSATASAGAAITLASRGIQMALSGAVGYFSDLQLALKGIDVNGQLTLKPTGAIEVRFNNGRYAVMPALSASLSQAPNPLPGFETGSGGVAVFRDHLGALQTLSPAFLDVNSLISVLKGVVSTVSVGSNANGTVTATVSGQAFLLSPEYTIIDKPVGHATDSWWSDSARFYLRNMDASAQGFSIR